MLDTTTPTDLKTLTAEEILERYAPTNVRENRGDWAAHHIDFEVGHGTAELHSAYQAFRTVYSVNVHVDHRGQGHGRRLMDVITAYADATGVGLNLSVFANNEAALRLYHSVGFEITYTRDGIHGMKRYPTKIPNTPEWDEHFKAEALRLERDREPRLGSDFWVEALDAVHAAREVAYNSTRDDRARYTGSANYEENSRRLYCDAIGDALLASGWTITRIKEA